MIYKNPKSYIRKYLDRVQSSSPNQGKFGRFLIKQLQKSDLDSSVDQLEKDYFLQYFKRNFKHTSQNPSPESAKKIFSQPPLPKISMKQNSYESNPYSNYQKSPVTPNISNTIKPLSITSSASPQSETKDSEFKPFDHIYRKKRKIFIKKSFDKVNHILKPNSSESPLNPHKYFPKQDPDPEPSHSSNKNEPQSPKAKQDSIKPHNQINFLLKHNRSRPSLRISSSKRLSRLIRSFSLEKLKTFKDFHLIKLFDF